MWHILLLILKIIGITIGILFAVLLLAGTLILFVPVRYQLAARGKFGEEEPLTVKLRIHWLCHLLSIRFWYPEAPYLRATLLGFTIYDPTREKKQSKARRKNRKSRRVKEEDYNQQPDEIEVAETDETANTDQACNEEKTVLTGEAGSEEETGKDNEADTSETKCDTEEQINADKENHDDRHSVRTFLENRFHKLKKWIIGIMEKGQKAFRKIEYTIKKICDKIRHMIGNLRYYADLARSETVLKAWLLIREQLIILWKELKPKKCSIQIKAGTGDPAGTGQMLAIYGMLYPFCGNYLNLEPDFDHLTFEGDALIRGRVKIIVVLIVLIRLYRDRNLRKLLKLIHKEET